MRVTYGSTMSPTAATNESPEATTDPIGPPSRRRRWLWITVLGVVLVAATTGWRVVGVSALDQVVVQVTDHDCGDTATVRVRRNGNLLVETTRDLRCTFTVTIANQGRRTVSIGEVRANIMGPDTGSVLLAESIAGATPQGDQQSVDALHTLGRDLAGGSTTSFDLVVVLNPEGCNDGVTLTLFGFPQVELSTLRVSRTVDAINDLEVNNTIRTPGCGPHDRAA
ncbi:hypothetical protein [Nocardioides coralli]|uniref:hypothetical protein n=1 Tax=Nocardioides coralli TaxID=2872154 RepID=UPI001CA3C485|nr:hypothetical protein [Nocardioides coralli]QZY29068.1 hypothetical protein K6T13_16820 [Nocardioides coralli]